MTRNIDLALKETGVIEKVSEYHTASYQERRLSGNTVVLEKENGFKYELWLLHYDITRELNKLASVYSSRANRNGFGYRISGSILFKLWSDQRGKCARTNRLMEFTSGTQQDKNPFKLSLDRIVNSRGYYSDNVRFVIHFYNNLKSTWPDELVESLVLDASNTIKKNDTYEVPV